MGADQPIQLHVGGSRRSAASLPHVAAATVGLPLSISCEQLDRLFGEAFGSSEPFNALRKLAEALVVQGVPQSELLSVFQEQLNRQAAVPNEQLYNALADVMDLIAGWCSAEASLYQPGASRGSA